VSVGYTSVQWNRPKKLYDGVLVAGILLTVGAFAALSVAFRPGITAETVIIRGTAVAALLLLHVVLAIGPLARLDRRFLPLLYNRRHLGVGMFLLALVHGAFSIVQFHALGNENPLVSVFTSYQEDYALFRDGALNLANFPFEVLGVGALLILFLMAATSHDFWLRNLGASVWKSLHLLVLVAYALVVLHVTLGALQSERNVLYPILLALGGYFVLGLHAIAAAREARSQRRRRDAEADGFVPACRPEVVPEGRGKTVSVGGERLAVFRHEGKIFALSNVCRHQGGPLGEGKIIDGCVTCPWHGWQYRAEDGCSPPPFTEIVPTYRVRLLEAAGGGEEIWIHPEAHPLETTSPGVMAPPPAAEDDEDFFVGYLPVPSRLGRRLRWVAVGLLMMAPVLALLVAWGQGSFRSGVFEFGKTRSFEGVLYETPVPMLRLTPQEGATTNLLLVSFGKHGLPEEARGHHGKKVSFDGSLIYRRGLSMVEMNALDTFRVHGDPGPGEARPPAESLGAVSLVGEIVDTKCFSGVMRPATGKVHRACAIRCISGGVPPGLLVRDTPANTEDAGDGRPGGTVFVLAGADGKALDGNTQDFDVEWAGRVVEARGELQLLDGLPVVLVASLDLKNSPE